MFDFFMQRDERRLALPTVMGSVSCDEAHTAEFIHRSAAKQIRQIATVNGIGGKEGDSR